MLRRRSASEWFTCLMRAGLPAAGWQEASAKAAAGPVRRHSGSVCADCNPQPSDCPVASGLLHSGGLNRIEGVLSQLVMAPYVLAPQPSGLGHIPCRMDCQHLGPVVLGIRIRCLSVGPDGVDDVLAGQSCRFVCVLCCRPAVGSPTP